MIPINPTKATVEHLRWYWSVKKSILYAENSQHIMLFIFSKTTTFFKAQMWDVIFLENINNTISEKRVQIRP